MDEKKQQNEGKICLYHLINKLELQIRIFLRAIGIFNQADLDRIESGTTQKEQRLKLLNILKSRKYEVNQLREALEQNKQEFLFENFKFGLLALQQNPKLYKEIERELKRPYSEIMQLEIPKLWEVPLRNPYFTDRNSSLDHVIACFGLKKEANNQSLLKPESQHEQFESKVSVIFVYQGLNGVGKTELATEFVHRCKDAYPYVFWFLAENSSQIKTAYRKLAQDLQIDTLQQIDTVEPKDSIVRDVKAWFERNPGCLLIYDNAPDSDSIYDYIPLNGCHILITSRNTDLHWLNNSKSFTVDVFTASEAQEYFQKLLGDRLDTNEVNVLTDLVGFSPSVLAKAGAFIKKNKVTIPRYIELYIERKEDLLNDDYSPESSDESKSTT